MISNSTNMQSVTVALDLLCIFSELGVKTHEVVLYILHILVRI